jgi:hypothetical protein
LKNFFLSSKCFRSASLNPVLFLQLQSPEFSTCQADISASTPGRAFLSFQTGVVFISPALQIDFLVCHFHCNPP